MCFIFISDIQHFYSALVVFGKLFLVLLVASLFIPPLTSLVPHKLTCMFETFTV
jgi:hypothetical protein